MWKQLFGALKSSFVGRSNLGGSTIRGFTVLDDQVTQVTLYAYSDLLVMISLVPRPSPSFLSLAVRFTVLLGDGLGTRLGDDG